jgi:hypothetical protein
MLDLIGAVVGMSAITINLVAFTHFLPGSLARRLALAGAAGAWVGLASGVGAAGRFAFDPGQPVPLIGVMWALPLLSFGVLALTSPKVRSALLAVPTQVLIGVNSLRLLGVLFLFLYAAGRLSGPFPFFAGLGDMITGALAIALALQIVRGRVPSAAALRRWNLFGALDLLVAVALGITSAADSPLQLFHVGAGSQAMQYLPFCLVPTVLVPFYLITHGIIAAQLRSPRALPAVSQLT